MHVINYLQFPDVFGSDRLSRALVSLSTDTAPIYFFGIAYPLSFIVPSKWILLIIGTTITGLSGYFAGRSWSDWNELLAGISTVFLILHVNISPLEGNRRSFTALFLTALVWLDEQNHNYLLKLFIVALASGIYPPMALIILAYFGLKALRTVFQKNKYPMKKILQLAGLLLVVILVLIPYWSNIIGDGWSFSTDLASRLQYKLASLQGMIETFLIGERGALFRDQLHFDLFVIFGILCLFQVWILEEEFSYRKSYCYLFLASLICWFMAHLVHPLIYHPFKYTRLSVLFVLVWPFADNLLATVKVLKDQVKNAKKTHYIFYFTALVASILWLLFAMTSNPLGLTGTIPYVGSAWWKFVFGFPIFVALAVVKYPISTHDFSQALFALIILFCLIVLPHNFPDATWNGINLARFKKMYSYLRQTPAGTTVAGPPAHFMDPIPAFAFRGIYASTNKTPIRFVCNRIKKFWKVYFQGESKPIVQFMVRNDIDYLLVDRKMLRTKRALGNLECMEQFNVDTKPFLNQRFNDVAWYGGKRFYLVSRAKIKRETKN
jgi:hypothetical protein